MPKRKISASSTGRTPHLKSIEKSIENFASSLACVRFAGVALGGGKTDRTAIVVLEYYPEHKKIFLRRIFERVKSEEALTADQVLLDILNRREYPLHSVTFDTPLSLPVCLLCDCRAPDYSHCPRNEVKWMWKVFRERSKTKRPVKMFTPYTERAAEIYISQFLEETFHPHHVLGANMAPLTARAIYLKSRLSMAVLETYPKLSLWRIGRSLKISKSYLRDHRHSGDGDESRLQVLKNLIERGVAFLYQQDVKLLVENWHAFEALMCALVGFLEYQGQAEVPPQDFPQESAWVTFPVEKIAWFEPIAR